MPSPVVLDTGEVVAFVQILEHATEDLGFLIRKLDINRPGIRTGERLGSTGAGLSI